MNNIITCPFCRQVVEVPEEYQGKTLRCPACKHDFRQTAEEGILVAPAILAPPRSVPPLPEEPNETWPSSLARSPDGLGKIGLALAYPFENRELAAACVVLLLVGMVLQAGNVVLEWIDYQNLAEQGVDDPNPLMLLIGLAQLGINLVFYVLFLIWLYRAYANLQRLGLANLSFTPGWVVGYFFVPFFNLFRPYQAIQETWKGSDPASSDPLTWHNFPGSPLVWFWWVVSWLALIPGVYSFQPLFEMDPGLEDLEMASLAAIFAGILGLISDSCLILVIHRITRRQVEKFRLK